MAGKTTLKPIGGNEGGEGKKVKKKTKQNGREKGFGLKNPGH